MPCFPVRNYIAQTLDIRLPRWYWNASPRVTVHPRNVTSPKRIVSRFSFNFRGPRGSPYANNNYIGETLASPRPRKQIHRQDAWLPASPWLCNASPCVTVRNKKSHRRDGFLQTPHLVFHVPVRHRAPKQSSIVGMLGFLPPGLSPMSPCVTVCQERFTSPRRFVPRFPMNNLFAETLAPPAENTSPRQLASRFPVRLQRLHVRHRAPLKDYIAQTRGFNFPSLMFKVSVHHRVPRKMYIAETRRSLLPCNRVRRLINEGK